MNFKLRIAAATIMAVSVVASYGQTSAAKAPAKKHVVTAKAKTPPPPTVAEQIQALRQELENQARQIESLKTGLAAKDAQLQKAQQAAADAQASAARAETAASAQQQAVTSNAAAVTTLQSSVSDLKGKQSRWPPRSRTRHQDQQGDGQPAALHYKGITSRRRLS